MLAFVHPLFSRNYYLAPIKQVSEPAVIVQKERTMALRIICRSLPRATRLLSATSSTETARPTQRLTCERSYSTPTQNATAHILDNVVYERYMALDISDKCLATYIWIDGTGQVSTSVCVCMSECVYCQP